MQIADVLCKLGRYFNEITEQCLSQMAGSENIRYKHRMILNQSSLKNFQINKKLNKLKTFQEDKKCKQQQFTNKSQIKSHKPKHPVSSFFFFYREKGQEIAKQHNETQGAQVAKLVANIWQGMTEAERQPYHSKAKKTRQKYEIQMKKYREQYPGEISQLKKQKEHLKKLKKKNQEDKKASLKKYQMNERLELVPSNRSFSSSNVSDSSSAEEDAMSDSLQIAEMNLKAMDIHQEPALIQQKKQIQEIKIQNYPEIQIQSPQEPINSKPTNLIENILNTETMQKQSNLIQSANVKQQENPPNKKPKKIKKQSSKPKGPISSFFIFYRDQGKKIADKNNIPLGPAAIKLTSAAWKKMTPEEKQPFEKLSKETREKYYLQKIQYIKKYGEEALEVQKATRLKHKREASSKKLLK